ncbi:MAG: dipeptidase [Flavobacteriaceae bacterium]|nr:dipeptidase [Flavobacteriaceae bacterium]
MSTEKNNYIDFHCHSAMKPFGKSYNYKTIGRNNPRRNRSSSIWKYNPPSLADKLINYIINLTKFSQASFTSLAKGGVNVICVSLYPIEKWFFVNKIKNEFIRDIAANFATGVGKKRIDAVQAMNNYFKDLEMEYDFYKQLDGKIIQLPEGKFRYKLVKSYNEIKAFKAQDQDKIATICVILSIEGMHVLNQSINKSPDEAIFMANLQKIKNWEHSPFFVGIAHHFWNHLCGHAESFTKLVKKKVDQSEGLNTGFTPLGIKIAHELLSTNNGKRILIDLKHMSVASRADFYKLIDDNPKYKNMPLIVSHGAANGLQSFTNKKQEGSQVAKKLNTVEINFFNEEIIRIAKSKGIFGLQLDERRIASKQTLKNTKHSLKRSKIMHYRSELLWNQVQHILEILDNEGLFAWDCLAIGSDFDGIIDPLNAFWTSEELPYLADFLERHTYNYMKTASFKVKENKLDADEIIDRIMSLNGLNFLKSNYK